MKSYATGGYVKSPIMIVENGTLVQSNAYRQQEATMENERKDADMSAWITVRQAAEIAGVSQQWIRYLLNEGLLESMRPGHEWLISRASVEAYKLKRDNQKD